MWEAFITLFLPIKNKINEISLYKRSENVITIRQDTMSQGASFFYDGSVLYIRCHCE